ncbi:hypothetical protein NSA19_01120 [Actinomyces bowdenii]|uniref:hypothetical protein n=1 Tax=Actinomyces bowdenii TaxID=131109 RepID=UPI00214B25BB|nr:hypothetical protein [Actinomyces bowdenii]MCR2051478.1 hypothetical protein [Actinomyces bowdenii]
MDHIAFDMGSREWNRVRRAIHFASRATGATEPNDVIIVSIIDFINGPALNLTGTNNYALHEATIGGLPLALMNDKPKDFDYAFPHAFLTVRDAKFLASWRPSTPTVTITLSNEGPVKVGPSGDSHAVSVPHSARPITNWERISEKVFKADISHMGWTGHGHFNPGLLADAFAGIKAAAPEAQPEVSLPTHGRGTLIIDAQPNLCRYRAAIAPIVQHFGLNVTVGA